MRNYPTIHRFVPILLLFVTVELAVGWEPAAFASTETPEPTLRDLIKGKSKEKQAEKRAAAENAELAIPDDPLGRGVPR